MGSIITRKYGFGSVVTRKRDGVGSVVTRKHGVWSIVTRKQRWSEVCSYKENEMEWVL